MFSPMEVTETKIDVGDLVLLDRLQDVFNLLSGGHALYIRRPYLSRIESDMEFAIVIQTDLEYTNEQVRASFETKLCYENLPSDES